MTTIVDKLNLENTAISTLIYGADQISKNSIAEAIGISAIKNCEDVLKEQAQKINYSEKDDHYVNVITGNVSKGWTNKAKEVLERHKDERCNMLLDAYKDVSTSEAAHKIANALKEAVVKATEDFSVSKCVDIAVDMRNALFNEDDQAFLDIYDRNLPHMLLAYYSMMSKAA